MNDTAATPALDTVIRTGCVAGMGAAIVNRKMPSCAFPRCECDIAPAMVKAALSAALADTPEALSAVATFICCPSGVCEARDRKRDAIRGIVPVCHAQGFQREASAALRALRQRFLGEG